MFESFNNQSKLVKVLLLIIPFVNWVAEIVLRCDSFFKNRKTGNILVLIVMLVFGIVVAYIDAISIALTNKMILAD